MIADRVRSIAIWLLTGLVSCGSLTAQAHDNQPAPRGEALDRAATDVQRWPVSGDAARQAVANLQPSIDWSDAQISISPEVTTRSERARLQALELRAGRTPGTLAVRLECKNPQHCVPFWAEMKFPLGLDAGHHLLRVATITSALASPEAGTHPALVQAGRPASLRFEQNGLRIFLQVMPLKRAALGESVKVYDPVTRRKFVALVCGRNLLQSDLRETK